jgi:hypothetical protein
VVGVWGDGVREFGGGSSTPLLALLGAFFGLLEAIGVALDGDDFGMVDEAIDQGDDAGGVGKDLAPFGKGSIGGNQGRFGLIAARDDLKEQVGVVVGVG